MLKIRRTQTPMLKIYGTPNPSKPIATRTMINLSVLSATPIEQAMP
jgi:hypothetical protein